MEYSRFTTGIVWAGVFVVMLVVTLIGYLISNYMWKRKTWKIQKVKFKGKKGYWVDSKGKEKFDSNLNLEDK